MYKWLKLPYFIGFIRECNNLKVYNKELSFYLTGGREL